MKHIIQTREDNPPDTYLSKICTVVNSLLCEHLEWCKNNHTYLDYKPDRIDKHAELVRQYFGHGLPLQAESELAESELAESEPAESKLAESKLAESKLASGPEVGSSRPM